ncbi:class I SAM-dependent methyltransferase [Streptomyces sioyaensis]|uniref:Class I SAM-dependent methyltransferase n=1 Tax=Streptomyces sioyaensis TaxID=67364 RepID=A0A4V1NPI7_9ACTN|nr:class I SAM-dependent methyltransferase [Streptomyces sioyaensis]MBM4796275.1 class I SAM-dependent methyltransferase [Streptomyces sioyaensis]RXS64960.1 class I SAM-dependent methyltransferase [Streptomyces sioyaensis]
MTSPRAKVQLTGEKETLLATLYGRAVDSRAKDPILGDPTAADTVRRLDYDFTKMRIGPGDAAGIALRARQLDVWTARFLARHEEATVVHLGCGLDSRVHRLDPGPGVRWYDIDYPEVIALRRELYPERAGYTAIASSVTDPAWTARIPSDRPTMVVAEGLLMYLTEEEGSALLRRLMAHAPRGELAFDAFSRFAIRSQRINHVVVAAGARLYWGTDAAGLARLSPQLTIVESLSMLELPGIAKVPARYRLGLRALAKVPAVRDMARLYRCRF